MTKYITILAFCLVSWSTATAQTTDPAKFEVAAEFVTSNRDSFSGSRSEMGFGGRFTFNFNRYFALETAGYFFPQDCFSCVENGRATQAVAGPKVGKRFKSWGVFAKARPGVVSQSRGQISWEANNSTGSFPSALEYSRVTSFAIDLGGVLEFYPSKRIVTRFDAGDTMIFFDRRVSNDISFNPITNSYSLIPITRPSRTSHNFQFMASVGFRF